MKKVGFTLLLLVVAFVLSACATTPATETFTATLNGTSERPNPVTTTATGAATVELKDKTMTLTGTFTNLSGAATLAHSHGPADENNTAPPLFDLTFTAATSGTLAASRTLTDAEITQLKGGQWYVNVHTGNNPGGEIRGQLK
jgi:CHRD domain